MTCWNAETVKMVVVKIASLTSPKETKIVMLTKEGMFALFVTKLDFSTHKTKF